VVAGHGSTGSFTLDHDLPGVEQMSLGAAPDDDGDACVVRVPESESAL